MIVRLLTRWLFNRRREIFRYWDGRNWRRIDPLVAYERMYRHPEALPERDWALSDEARIKTGTMTDEDLTHHRRQWAAHSRTASLARFMFDIPALNQKLGLTDDEAVSILTRFIYYLADLKKKRDPPPKQHLPTEVVFSGESTTPPGSASCSTPPEPKSDAPPSPST